MDGFRRSGLAAFSVAVLLFASAVNAHGHDEEMSKIVEGEYMTAEPLVRQK